MRHICKKLLCVLLCFATLLSVFVMPLQLLAATSGTGDGASTLSNTLSDGKNAVTNTQTVTHQGVDYIVERTTQFIGARAYSVQVNIRSSIGSQQGAQDITSSQNGYITVNQSGWYLLQLWGGDGANGEPNKLGEIELTPGGAGAAGGYVYAKVYLKENQTLVYSIGTNGQQAQINEDEAGGENGEGGIHGDVGSRVVGGGGGFSALYLFQEDDEFDSKWVTPGGVELPEGVRTTRYIMIAGGGGGGGAGAAAGTTDDHIYAPNGGAGGTSTRPYSVDLNSSSYTVPGYVFSGRNGSSSGDSTSYVGIGGSSVPGTSPSSMFNWYDASTDPNDWTGTYNPDVEYGSGGTGNLRGGGGGAGYAGGSGGVMAGLIMAENVGGGGGGSSFIAATVNEKAVEFGTLDDTTMEYVEGVTGQPSGNGIGGAFQMTYLGDGETSEGALGLASLQNVTFTGTFFRYFSVNEQSYAMSDGVKIGAAIAADANGRDVVTFEGLDITPATATEQGKTASVYLVLVAKEDFAGGNAIPLVEDMNFSFIDPQNSSNTDVVTVEADEKQDFVNVPLKFSIKTNSYTTKLDSKTYQTADFYTDSYASVRGSLSSHWQYDGISSIGTYQVYNGTTLLGTSVTITGTTQLTVQYTVTLKSAASDAVPVGPGQGNPTVISKAATVTKVDMNTGTLNGITVQANKRLEYVDDTYQFSVDLEQSISAEFMYTAATYTSGTDATWEVPQDGWYMIQAWGGNGGTGGAVFVNHTTNSYDRSAGGGSGAGGGYVAAYAYLTAGQQIVYTVGTKGSDYSPATTTIDMSGTLFTVKRATPSGGSGGSYTTVRLGTDANPFMIAGGGGGGGGAAGISTSSSVPAVSSGKTRDRNTGVSTTLSSSMSTYTGNPGNSGSVSGNYVSTLSATGGTAGANGSNYRNSSYASGYDTTESGRTLSADALVVAQGKSTTKSVTSGQVRFTLLESDAANAEKEKVNSVEGSIVISRYFDIQDVTLTPSNVNYAASAVTTTTTDNGDGTVTVDRTHSTYGLFASVTYSMKTAADGLSTLLVITDSYCVVGTTYQTVDSTQYAQFTADFSFTVTLLPKEGFLGGNDVPILTAGQIEDSRNDVENPVDLGVRLCKGEDALNLTENATSDYANVELDFSYEHDPADISATPIFTTQDATIHQGDSVSVSSLYAYTSPASNYTGENAWKADFVTFVDPLLVDHDPVDAQTLSPTATTTYTISPYLRPKADAVLATTVESVSEVSYPLQATVYVEVEITYLLENISSNGVQWVAYGQEYRFTLTPASGYLLPDGISVTDVNGNAVSSFTYDSKTGEVVLAADAVITALTVTATAEVPKYLLHYIYELYDPATGEVTEHTYDMPEEQALPAGTPVDFSFRDGVAAPERPGYTYAWTYETADGVAPDVMPAHDLWVYGNYTALSYQLTVTYVMSDGSTPPAAVTQSVVYGEAYSVTSPSVKGYLADITVVSGTMEIGGKSVTVTYTPSANTLMLVYLKRDGTKLGEDSFTMSTNESYSITPKAFAGYTASLSPVEGTMTGDESETVIVYYDPNTYTVTFAYQYGEQTGATLDGDATKLVEYDNTYGYDAEAAVYNGLPTPQIAGFNFAGWYLSAAFADGELVTDTTTVAITADATLYPKWEKQKFKLTVRYEFLYTDDDFLPEGYASADEIRAELPTYTAMVEYESTYAVPSKKYVGYTAYVRYALADQAALPTEMTGSGEMHVLTGDMGGQNLLLVVTYVINVYDVDFMYKAGQRITYSDAGTVDQSVMDADLSDEDRSWATVQVKHNIAPEYPLVEAGTPTHATRAAYTYAFTGWYSTDNGLSYEGATPALPVAVSDVTYYSEFAATENIASVTANGATRYFTSLAAAALYCDNCGVTSGITLALRRNSGNGTDISANGDTLVFGTAYTGGTTAISVTVNFNGYTLHNTQGETVLDNTVVTSYSLTLQGAGGITVSGEGDVIAVNVDASTLTFSSALTLSATSATGNATALRYASGSTLSMTASPSFSATAPAGDANAIHLDGTTANTLSISSSSYKPVLVATGKNAYGIRAESLGSVSTFYGSMQITGEALAYGFYNVSAVSIGAAATNMTVTATAEDGIACGIIGATSGTLTNGAVMTVSAPNGTAYGMIFDRTRTAAAIRLDVSGKHAVGVEVRSGATATFSSYYLTLNVTGVESAIGIDVLEGGTFAYSTTTVATLNATAQNGDAYGVRNQGSITTLGFNMTVEATGDAFGIYNLGGTVSGSGIRTATKVIASSTSGQSIGLYSVGGAVGTESAPLKAGSFAGSTFGIYCTDGSIVVSGNDLFFKGEDEESALYENTAEPPAEGETAVLNGVIILEGYSQVEANAGDPFSGAVGYYRLGRTWTITFVTNGGTEIAAITQVYDTPLTAPADPTRRGYDFAGWHSDADLTVSYTIPAYMPDADRTIYADWTIIEYLYTLDAIQQGLLVLFYKNPPIDSVKESVEKYVMPTHASSITLSDPPPAEYYDEATKTLYVFTGWYTSEQRSASTYVALNGNLSSYDTDGDGVLRLYAGWQPLTSCADYTTFGTDAGSAYIVTAEHTSSNYFLMYFVVREAGTYRVSTANLASSTSNSYRKYIYVLKYSYSTSYTQYYGSYKTASTSVSYGTSGNSFSALAGDVIVVRCYRYGSSTSATYNSTVYAKLTTYPTAVNDWESYTAYSDQIPFTDLYTVADGEVKLKVPEQEGYQFIGWSDEAVESDSGDLIIKLTPEMVEAYDAWVNGETLDLYAQWEEITWDGFQAAGSSWDSSMATSNQVYLRDNGTVTLRFALKNQAHSVTASAVFSFASGLPKGTILTLVDYEAGKPVYYTHTVKVDLATTVSASEFLRMGDATQSFAGMSKNVLLQICYVHADVTASSETVGIIVENHTPEVEVTYRLIDSAVEHTDIGEATFDTDTTHEVELTVPDLSGEGFATTDRVFLIVRWGTLSMAPGVVFKVGEHTGTLWDGSAIRIDLGQTVADFSVAAGTVLTLSYSLPTMYQNEFDATAFTYEIAVLPAGIADTEALDGIALQRVVTFGESITLTETPSLTVEDAVTHRVTVGDTLLIEGILPEDADATVQIFILTLDEDGQLTFTDDCLTLFTEDSGYTVSAEGEILPVDSTQTALLTDGNFEAVVSAQAVAGRYYFKILAGEKFVYVSVYVSNGT